MSNSSPATNESRGYRYVTLCAGLNRMMHFSPTQQEWDEIELRNMKRDHESGLVLRYEVIG